MNQKIIIIGKGEEAEESLTRMYELGYEAILIKEINESNPPKLTDLVMIVGKYTSPENNLSVIKKIGEEYISPLKLSKV